MEPLQLAIHRIFSTPGLAGADDRKWAKLTRPAVADDFDKMATVVDWLDACRSRRLDALLDFYGDSATLQCACEDISVNDRSGLAAYWRPKLAGASADAFTLEEITPRGEGVALDYLGFDGKAVRIVFAFDAHGKIAHMSCRPAPR
jgi:hypothetical protein